MSDIQTDKKRLFDILLKDAFAKGKFILSSGKESNYYLDARKVTLTPEGAYLSAKIILGMAKDKNVDAIGGPTLGADPMVGAVASLSFEQGNPVNSFIIRKAPKAHGKQQQIEGPLLKKGAKVILIDDVATTGKAFVQSIEVMKKEGFELDGCICLVDRKEGATEAVEALGCTLSAVFDIAEFLNA
ncbi:MAG: orotate phosphoribosyltransferase [Candidatus Aceula meridiana]|nr:orotate phosphoribosyltransferase [Candidatus Aceula meridiana]